MSQKVFIFMKKIANNVYDKSIIIKYKIYIFKFATATIENSLNYNSFNSRYVILE